jgi:hypothetical protein
MSCCNIHRHIYSMQAYLASLHFRTKYVMDIRQHACTHACMHSKACCVKTSCMNTYQVQKTCVSRIVVLRGLEYVQVHIKMCRKASRCVAKHQDVSQSIKMRRKATQHMRCKYHAWIHMVHGLFDRFHLGWGAPRPLPECCLCLESSSRDSSSS